MKVLSVNLLVVLEMSVPRKGYCCEFFVRSIRGFVKPTSPRTVPVAMRDIALSKERRTALSVLILCSEHQREIRSLTVVGDVTVHNKFPPKRNEEIRV